MSSSTSADLIILDLGQLPRDQILHNRPYFRAISIMIDIDPNLSESHKGSHSNAPYDESVYLMACQEIHRDHTSSLDMTTIGDGADVLYFTVFHINQGEHITVTEMA